MAWKSYEAQSRDANWGGDGTPDIERLQYGATARIATALEDLNMILRQESRWWHQIPQSIFMYVLMWRAELKRIQAEGQVDP